DRLARRRPPDRRQRGGDDGGDGAVVGADRLVPSVRRRAHLPPGEGGVSRATLAIVAVAAAMALLPLAGLPAFYDALLYLMLHWIVLATSWNILRSEEHTSELQSL